MPSEAANTEAGILLRKRTLTLDPEKGADSPLSSSLISPGHPACTTSICDSKCFVLRLCNFTVWACWPAETLLLVPGNLRAKRDDRESH